MLVRMLDISGNPSSRVEAALFLVQSSLESNDRLGSGLGDDAVDRALEVALQRTDGLLAEFTIDLDAVVDPPEETLEPLDEGRVQLSGDRALGDILPKLDRLG